MFVKIAVLILILISFICSAETPESMLSNSLSILQRAQSGQFLDCFDYHDGSPRVPTARKMQCEQRPNGLRAGEYWSGNEGKFHITRTSEKSYQALLNFKFVPDLNPPGNGRPGDANLARKLLQKTRNCLNELKPLFRGPNGEELEIAITTDSEARPGTRRPVATEIKVHHQDDSFRANSIAFGSKIDCMTIGHEILHHLGLCDEYHEGVIEYGNNQTADWDCRPVAGKQTIMKNMFYAYKSTVPLTSKCDCGTQCQAIMLAGGKAKSIYLSMNGHHILADDTTVSSQNNRYNPDRNICKVKETVVVDQTDVPDAAFQFESQNSNVYRFSSYNVSGEESFTFNKTTYECTCKPHQIFCEKTMNEFKSIAQNVPKNPLCPEGTSARSSEPSIGSDPKGSRIECNGGNCDLIVTTAGSGSSLLYPAHFSKIIGANCPNTSKAYQTCEKYFYMSKNDPLCRRKPVHCNSDDFLLNGILPK